MNCVGHLIVGPAGHGVVEVAELTARGPTLRVQALAELPWAVLIDVDVIHIHYTDRLFGATVESAAAAFLALVRTLHRPVTVTLHDLPLATHDTGWRVRRERAYRDVSRAAAGVVVSSRHEAGRVLGNQRVCVIPLPIDRLPDPEVRPAVTAEVGILGWIYPGKGHAEVLAELPPGMMLTAIGAASPGHDHLLRELEVLAQGRLRVTGHLDDDAMTRTLRSVAVPVAAHHDISASASIGRWLGAGRRPLVADGAWVRELEARCPGALLIYEPSGLEEAILEAAADPASTWLGAVQVNPNSAEVAEQLHTFALSVL